MKIKSTYQGPQIPAQTKVRRQHAERFVFNFSFLTQDKKYNLDARSKTINHKVRVKMLERIWQLSQNDIVEVMAYPREQGFEKIPAADVRLSVHPELKNSHRDEECDTDYWVFRLSKLGRVISKRNDNILYIMSIDASFDQYDHG